MLSDPAAIRAAQEANLAAMLDLAFEHHPYYRERFREAGLSRGDIRSLADLPRLPITTKADFLSDPERFRLETDHLAPEMRVVWDVMYTTGTTTGRPTPFYSTSYDLYNILTLNRRMLEIRGVTERDSIANLYPLTLHPQGAFIRTLHAAAVANLPVVSAMPGRPSPRFTQGNGIDGVVKIVERSRVTILWGVPSYVRRVLIRAEELGADFATVRLVFVSGESVAEPLREDLTARMRRLGAADPVVSISYGATEMQGGMVECRPGSGYHNPAPEQFYVEIVEPGSGRPLPEGEKGQILLTHLDRRGTVLLRYALGDVTAHSTAPCPRCGRCAGRLTELPRRTDELVKIKGMLVNPEVIAGILVRERAVSEYQIVIEKERADDPFSMDRLLLRIAVSGEAPEAVSRRIAEAVKQAVGVTPVAEVVPVNAIYDPDQTVKSKRLVDRRPAGQ
jgi:phenylacetate-coenzyme A ligase PaaK-like adenylate-forming protein